MLKNLKGYECSQGDDDGDVMGFKSRGSKQHGRREDQSSSTKQASRCELRWNGQRAKGTEWSLRTQHWGVAAPWTECKNFSLTEW